MNIKAAPVRARSETFEHGADIGVRGTGRTASDAFEMAAEAMSGLITSPTQIQHSVVRSFRCDAPDLELLLMDWLNELISCMATENLVFGKFEVVIDASRLKGTAWGEPLDQRRHRPAVEVKGATLTELKVRRIPGGWLAQCVVDV